MRFVDEEHLTVYVRSEVLFFFSSRRRHTRYIGDWSSDVCSSDLHVESELREELDRREEAADVDLGGARRAVPVLLQVDPEDPVRPRIDREDRLPREIGRASCRERVERLWAEGAANESSKAEQLRG